MGVCMVWNKIVYANHSSPLKKSPKVQHIELSILASFFFVVCFRTLSFYIAKGLILLETIGLELFSFEGIEKLIMCIRNKYLVS